MATRKSRAQRAAKHALAELSNTSNTYIEENTDEAAPAATVEMMAVAVGGGEGKNNPAEGNKDSIAEGANRAPADPDKAPPDHAPNDETGAAAPPKKSRTNRLLCDLDSYDDEGGVKIGTLPPMNTSTSILDCFSIVSKNSFLVTSNQ